jgi:hypothetical protein
MKRDILSLSIKNIPQPIAALFVADKINQGAVLDRDDLELILQLISEKMPTGSYYELAMSDNRVLPPNICGYKKIGKRAEGKSKQEADYKLLARNIRITEDYEKLIDKNNIPYISSHEAVEKLASESKKMYGVSIGERAIRDAITEGRKAIRDGMTADELESLPAF